MGLQLEANRRSAVRCVDGEAHFILRKVTIRKKRKESCDYIAKGLVYEGFRGNMVLVAAPYLGG
jgi:hypothetical protein